MSGFSVFLALASVPAKSDDDALLSAAGQSSADEALPDAASLLESMATAMSSLNYEGSFVHAQGTNLTVIDFVHASYPEGEFERLVSLDGEAREVIRTDTLVTCIWPGSESVIVTDSKPRDLLPRIEVDITNQDMRYQFSLAGKDRVADRDTYVVDVIPNDGFRYGYRFWIDEQTNVMLRSMLLDGPDQPVEQVIFTHIEFPETIDRSRFDFTEYEEKDGRWMSWLREKNDQATALLKDPASGQSDRISFSSLPPGYSELSETYLTMTDNEEPLSHVMLSDGMASVSVYVNYVPTADNAEAIVGLSRMGAMSAYGYRTDAGVVTVVGAVPEATVKAIGAAVVIN